MFVLNSYGFYVWSLIDVWIIYMYLFYYYYAFSDVDVTRDRGVFLTIKIITDS